MDNKKESIKEICKDYLKSTCTFAFLFGSFTTDHFRKDSDIDIAVFFNENPDIGKKIDIQVELETVLKRDVDLVCLNDSDPIISMQILANGELIVENDRSAFISYKANQISKYIDFKQSRKIIEDSLGTKRDL